MHFILTRKLKLLLQRGHQNTSKSICPLCLFLFPDCRPLAISSPFQTNHNHRGGGRVRPLPVYPGGGQGPDDLRTYILTNLAQISAQVVIVFQVIVVALAVCQMVCARCGQWIENQWLFWRYWDPSRFLPPDVQFVSYWDPSLFLPPVYHQFVSHHGPSYFFCACCMIEKYENERWTPGSYQNEDGHESTDDEDEHFLYVQLPYCRWIISSPAASYETAEETGPVLRHGHRGKEPETWRQKCWTRET